MDTRTHNWNFDQIFSLSSSSAQTNTPPLTPIQMPYASPSPSPPHWHPPSQAFLEWDSWSLHPPNNFRDEVVLIVVRVQVMEVLRNRGFTFARGATVFGVALEANRDQCSDGFLNANGWKIGGDISGAGVKGLPIGLETKSLRHHSGSPSNWKTNRGWA